MYQERLRTALETQVQLTRDAGALARRLHRAEHRAICIEEILELGRKQTPTRCCQQRSRHAESSSAAAPCLAADVAKAFALASSPVVRDQSGETLAAIQPAAARWRQAVVKVVAVGRFDNRGAAAKGGGGNADGGGNDSKDGVRAEEDDEDGPPISWVQDEVLCIIFSLLDAKTLMITVPQVCKFWRGMCQELSGVHLDFRWCDKRKVPLEVFAGWRVLPLPLTVEGADGGRGSAGDGRTSAGGGWQQGGRWASGVCELFPHTTSVTMGEEQGVEDAHLLALFDKCRELTHADFNLCCENLTDTAVLALADKCRGLTHAKFFNCENLTDAAVLSLALKCRGLTHADFGYCDNLTDAAVLALAATCHGLTHAAFGRCKLTDAAVLGLAAKCHGLTHADFNNCWNLTDTGVLALSDKCRGLTHAIFYDCRKLTDAAVLGLAARCRGLTHVDVSGCSKLTDAAKATVQEHRPRWAF